MKRLLYLFYILIIVIVAIPKEKLYFTFEQILSKKNIFISGESLNNHFVYLDVQSGALMVDNLRIATVENIRLSPWILVNRLSISSVTFSPLYRPFFPGSINNISLTYSLWHPLSVQIHGEGDFGQCNGTFDLIDQKVRIVFDTTPQLRHYPLLVTKLHSQKEGLVYEKTF
ncbi:MAG: hypothetical protein ACXW33_01020 [Sulfuricurvum sp.]